MEMNATLDFGPKSRSAVAAVLLVAVLQKKPTRNAISEFMLHCSGDVGIGVTDKAGRMLVSASAQPVEDV